MGTIVEDARSAGFSDDEISNWVSGQKENWQKAGFNDQEIGSYLTGLKNPGTIPTPFLGRFNSENLPPEAPPNHFLTIPNRVGEAFIEGATSQGNPVVTPSDAISTEDTLALRK